MRANQSSLTAMSTAAERALEMERPVGERICSDVFARQFIPAWYYAFMKRITFTQYAESHAAGSLGFIVTRCRFMDDLLSEELEKGLQQLVILGAGFDSRAYRFERLRQGVKVFEVDHPATQKKKMQKLERVLGSEGLPPSMTFVPVDFTRDSLADRLRQCGYSERLKTLFIWEGVTPYLDAAAVDRTLAFVVGHAAPGSSIVFDYMCEPPVTPKRDAVILLVSFLRRLVDEVRGFEIDRQQIEAYLLSRGFHRVDTITAADLQARYCIGPNTGRAVSSGYAIAVGVV